MVATVTRDKELSYVARVVFNELVLWLKLGEDTVCRGQRAIANAIGAHQETVSRSIEELELRGHLKVEKRGRGYRDRYVLTSWVYREKSAVARRSRKKAAA